MKLVLQEPRRSSQLTDVMADYDAAIDNPKRFGNMVREKRGRGREKAVQVTGALMFAVFRGKVSGSGIAVAGGT